MRKSVDLGIFGEYLHYGMPLALVSVLDKNGKVNLATVASMTPLPGEPARLVLGIFEENYTSALLKEQKEFALNFVTSQMRSVARTCGIYSGKETDKVALCNLNLIPAKLIAAPLVKECPLNIECRITDVLTIDGLNLFVSEILTLEIEESLSDGHNGIQIDKLDLLFYAFGNTFARGPMVGHGAI
jgi:flavin reductase (DIM6/NTAB) family NADH-FMN oxidoreductase RutF